MRIKRRNWHAANADCCSDRARLDLVMGAPLVRFSFARPHRTPPPDIDQMGPTERLHTVRDATNDPKRLRLALLRPPTFTEYSGTTDRSNAQTHHFMSQPNNFSTFHVEIFECQHWGTTLLQILLYSQISVTCLQEPGSSTWSPAQIWRKLWRPVSRTYGSLNNTLC